MACAVEAGRVDEAIEHASKVLEQGQHDLPGEVLAQCRAAIEARACGDWRGVEASLRDALASAERSNFF